jgi:hypothetical protein
VNFVVKERMLFGVDSKIVSELQKYFSSKEKEVVSKVFFNRKVREESAKFAKIKMLIYC